VPRDSRPIGGVAKLLVMIAGLDAGEHLERRAGNCQSFAYGLRTLGEELALTGPERTIGEPPGVLHPS
jgi:hypothetical protein